MTDKLHCPWCGGELIFCTQIERIQTCVCCNPTCKYDGYHFPVEVIQQLIDGKKAQEILKGIKRRVVAIRSCVQDGYTQLGERNRNIFIALELFKDLIKEITSITKQADK